MGMLMDSGAQLHNRALVACGACGWVHYVMTADEKAAQDRMVERYQLDPKERDAYESAFRQCLRCESPVGVFHAARDRDLARAASHIITPVLL